MAITGQAFTLNAFLDLPGGEAGARIRRGGGETKSVAGDIHGLLQGVLFEWINRFRVAAKAGDGRG